METVVESEVAVRLDRKKFVDAPLLITPPLTIATSSLDLIFAAVILTFVGILLFHGMASNESRRWKSPTLPLLFCLLLIITSLVVAKLLSLGE